MSNVTCEEVIAAFLRIAEEGFACDRVGQRLRIVTPYFYPDNDLIEVFIEDIGEGSVRVTDMAETLRHLDARGFDVSSSPKRRFMVQTIASRAAVDFDRGRLSKIGPVSALGNLMIDVVVTARGVSDLIYTSRTFEPATFVEEVEDYLKHQEVEFERGAPLMGISGKRYRVEFKVSAPEIRYIHTISPAAIQGMKSKVDATVRMWVDCNHTLTTPHKVTVLNDVDFQWREYDVAILQRYSVVQYWSRREELPSLLMTRVQS